MGKKVVIIFIFLFFSFCFSGHVLASGYETSWGKELTDKEVEAMASLRAEAERLCLAGDSDVEKVRELNEYVCDNAEFDYSYACVSLSDFVEKGKATCQGYAETLAYLLDCVNIKNFTVTAYVNAPDGAQALHIWNVVSIDGRWLHVDATWNDSSRDGLNPDGRYFLLGCAEMKTLRPKLLLNTAGDYDRIYNLLKTVTVTLPVSFDTRTAADGLYPLEAGRDGAAGIVIQNGTALGPVKEIICALGGCVKEEENGRITVILGTHTLVMTAGSAEGMFDSAGFTFAAPPRRINGVVMMPVREVLEKLGAKVDYNGAVAVITLSYDPYTAQ